MLYICIIIFLVLVGLFLYWQDNDIVITEMDYQNDKIPKKFNNLKILQISDFHNKKFGKDHKNIMKKIVKVNPDLIFITGDTIDFHHPNPEVAYSFLEKVSKLAPTYLISGNHEHTATFYEEYIENYAKKGVILLEDKLIELKRDDDKIIILGMRDFKEASIKKLSKEAEDSFEKRFKKNIYKCDKKEFKLVLSHRPELFDIYEKYNADLVFTGHAHGGQFRFLFMKGFLAPGQGFFPKYTAGTYAKGNTTMIVSRGLGNSVIPFRVFNRPELIVVNLKSR